jgi:hypothetical protein
MSLPKRVFVRNGRYYFRRKRRGVETYIRLPDASDPSFSDAVAEAERATATEPASPIAARSVRLWHSRKRRYAADVKLPKELVLAARQARKRAARKGLPFDLTLEQLTVLWQRSGARCEVSGMPFDPDKRGHRWPPFAISIDRRDNLHGYTYSNVRLVCLCVNTALNQWGDGIFWSMVFGAEAKFRGDADRVCPPLGRIG